MTIEQEIFQRKSVIPEKLEAYGFEKKGDRYYYSAVFTDMAFRADIEIGADGRISGKVFDLEAGCEYDAVHASARYGAFVESVREGYRGILRDIAANCFRDRLFIYDQSNRIADALYAKYGDKPDFPFSKYPGYGSFRCPENNKWYGLIGNIPKKSFLRKSAKILDKKISEEDLKCGDEIIEAINVKIKPDHEAELLRRDGFYPGYHMNKKNWVSIILDDTVSDQTILEFLEHSRELAGQSGRKSIRTGSGNAAWIVPANPKYFDVISHFKGQENVTWKQGAKIRTGDILYMYVAAPYSCIKYKGKVTEINIPFEYSSKKVNMKYMLRMDVLEEYDDDYCTFDKLRELGIKAVRGQRTAPGNLIEYMEKNSGSTIGK